MSRSKVLFMMSGSIAAFKACQVISRLVQDGYEVQVVTTPSAQKFIGHATLEGLTGRKVFSDMFADGNVMDHIHLSRWADFGVICPASANTLARLAVGLAEDLVSALALAWPKGKPLSIFPAMNAQMWDATPTKENLAKLTSRGFFVAPTAQGSLACGEEGFGRLLEPEEILGRLRLSNEVKGEVLITAGATREPIDGIRFISNVSTGQTGSELADHLSTQGWRVTYLHGQGAALPKGLSRNIEYSSFEDLQQKLRWELDARAFSGIIHCAAVSDYSLAEIQRGDERRLPSEHIKLRSDEDVSLRLKVNPKLLPRLKAYSRNKGIKVVGFKLTLNANEKEIREAAEKVWDDSVDAVVANDWSQVVADRLRHPGVLMTRSAAPYPFRTLGELSFALDEFFSTGEKK
jgi:phosphopantothenoylcysteine decarboxylase/phosphopantothenate--cysteine ligase